MERAIADDSAAIALEPGKAMAYNNRGYDLMTKGDLNGALADLNRALELDPRYLRAMVNRAFVRLGRGELALALADADSSRPGGQWRSSPPGLAAGHGR